MDGKTISIYVDTETLKQVDAVARREGRSRSNLINRLLREAVADKCAAPREREPAAA